MITKAAARYMDFIANLSPEAKARMFRGMGINPADLEKRYIEGIEKGTNNILNRYGYVRADVDAATPDQIKQLESLTKDRLNKALARNDIEAAQIEQAELSKLKNPQYARNKINDEAVAKGSDSGAWYNSATNNALRFTHTVNGKTSKGLPFSTMGSNRTFGENPLFNALISRHEAYEAAAKEKLLQKRRKLINSNSLFNSLKAKNPGVSDKDIIGFINESKIDPYKELQSAAMLNRKPGALIDSIGNPIGTHLDLDILTNERKLMDRLPMQDSKGLNDMRILRDATNETTYLNNASGYVGGVGKERINKKHLKNLYNYGTKREPASGLSRAF